MKQRLLSGLLALVLVLGLAPAALAAAPTEDEAAQALAADYGRIIGLSYVLNGITLVYVAAWRSMERPGIGMYILAASMGTNTFLNWVLIFGKLGAPALGVTGAAIATLIARVVEITIVLIHARRSRVFRLDLKLLFRPGLNTVRQFVRYGSPVVCNETMWGLGTAIFPTIMGHMAGSTEILAAYTIAGNVEKLCAVAAFGISGTASIIIGREIGAGRADTVYQVGLALNTLAAVGGAILGACLLAFTHWSAPAWFFPLFHLSPSACAAASTMMTVQACVMPIRDFNTCNIVGVLRGGGDVKTATLIDLSPLWLCAIPLAALAGLVLRLNILWVYLAMSTEQLAKCIAGVARLRTGKWIHDLTRPQTME